MTQIKNVSLLGFVSAHVPFNLPSSNCIGAQIASGRSGYLLQHCICVSDFNISPQKQFAPITYPHPAVCIVILKATFQVRYALKKREGIFGNFPQTSTLFTYSKSRWPITFTNCSNLCISSNNPTTSFSNQVQVEAKIMQTL